MDSSELDLGDGCDELEVNVVGEGRKDFALKRQLTAAGRRKDFQA